MGLPNYLRPAFGPSVLGSSFRLKRGSGYHIGRAASLGLESGSASPFLQPYQFQIIEYSGCRIWVFQIIRDRPLGLAYWALVLG